MPINGLSRESLTYHSVPSSYLDQQNIAKLVELYHLIPLSLPYCDHEGRQIQLWKTHQYGLIASVLDANGHLKIIPTNKVCHALSSTQEDLLKRIETIGMRQWHLCYLQNECKVMIWPLLTAAGMSYSEITTKFEHIKEKQCGLTTLRGANPSSPSVVS